MAQVFTEEKLHALPGELAIGHTRYSTTGAAKWENAQPVVHHGAERWIALGHNGNLTNAGALRDELRAEGIHPSSTSDTELIAALLARDPNSLPEAVAQTMARLEGAYSVVAIAEEILVAFRDPHGIRPLEVGRIGDDWVIASETCAFDLVGAEHVREVRPGELPTDTTSFMRASQLEHPNGRVGDRSALFRFVVDDDCGAAMGCALGGTSLINAGVALRPDDRSLRAGLHLGCHVTPFAGITPQVLRVGAGGVCLPDAISAGLPASPPGIHSAECRCYRPAEMTGRVRARTKSSSWAVVQHSKAVQYSS